MFTVKLLSVAVPARVLFPRHGRFKLRTEEFSSLRVEELLCTWFCLEEGVFAGKIIEFQKLNIGVLPALLCLGMRQSTVSVCPDLPRRKGSRYLMNQPRYFLQPDKRFPWDFPIFLWKEQQQHCHTELVGFTFAHSLKDLGDSWVRSRVFPYGVCMFTCPLVTPGTSVSSHTPKTCILRMIGDFELCWWTAATFISLLYSL